VRAILGRWTAWCEVAQPRDSAGEVRRELLFDPCGQELGQYTTDFSVWDDQYVPLGGRQIAKYYGCCDTMFVHPNHLGSTTMITNAAGTVMRDLVFYPYGQTWRNIGNNWDLHFASLWQREFASGLDPTPNRLYHSRLFRWMTPDEFTGGPTDAVNTSVGGPDPTPRVVHPRSAGQVHRVVCDVCGSRTIP